MNDVIRGKKKLTDKLIRSHSHYTVRTRTADDSKPWAEVIEPTTADLRPFHKRLRKRSFSSCTQSIPRGSQNDAQGQDGTCS